MRLKNKNIMIVGAGSEMGHTLIMAMLKQGANLFLTSRTDLKYEYETGVFFCKADPKNGASMREAAETMEQTLGSIDGMVYLPGIIRHLCIDEMSDKDWDDVINVNLTGCFYACRAVVPFMKHNKGGHIVLVSSIGGRTGRPVGCNYSASKAGIVGMTMSLAMELASYGITVNGVAPGPLHGRLFDSMSEERKIGVQRSIPLGRIGRFEDIIPGIVYLISDEASWITGEVLDINGGSYM